MNRHRVLVDATAARFGGTVYAIIWLARLLATRTDVEGVYVITRRGSMVATGLAGADGIELIELRRDGRFELLRRLVWQALRLRATARSTRATVLISPGGMLPGRPPLPLISYLLNPVAFEEVSLANALRRRAIARTTRGAHAVLVPSRHMRRLVTAATGREPEIVPLGIERTRFHPGDSVGSDLLCVADFYRHKRHDVILDAWGRLPEPRPRLRLIGNPGVDEAWAEEVRRRAGDGVVIEHGLSVGQLADAYREAQLFLLASERESFCMPLAEALASGVPGVVRGTDTLRETGGDGCVYVADDEAAEWAEAIAGLIDDPKRHAALSGRALAHAQRYSFEHMTDGILARAPKPEQALAPRDLAPVALLLTAVLTLLIAVSLVVARDTNRAHATVARATPTATARNTPAPAGPAALNRRTSFGPGARRRVRSPVPGLVSLGDTWHRVTPPVGRIGVLPSGKLRKYFGLAFVVYAPHPERLEILTSRGEKALVTIGANHVAPVTLGPFRAAAGAFQGLALYPVGAVRPSPGGPVTVGPIEARYLPPGGSLFRQQLVMEHGPRGVRGLPVPYGSPSTIVVAPGLTGQVRARLTLAVDGPPADLAVRVGGRTRHVRVNVRTPSVTAGPFPAGTRVRIIARAGRPGRLFLERVRLVGIHGAK